MGYHWAGFDVLGVDINPQPSYPFEFVQADALDYLAEHGGEYDVIHASPPCQAYSGLRSLVESRWGKKDYPDLVEPTRKLLKRSGKIYVIENVPGAPLINPIMLCGEMFGLKTFRHRLFETNVFFLSPPHPRHPRNSTTNSYAGYSSFARGATHISPTGNNFSMADARVAMGIDWMRTRREISQAIPPAYTEWIGRQLLRHLTLRGADLLRSGSASAENQSAGVASSASS